MIKTVFRIILLLFGLFILGWLVFEIRTILLYLAISFVVVLIGRPIMLTLDRVRIRQREIPNAVKAAITLLIVFTVFGSALGYFVPAIFAEAELLANLDVNKITETLAPVLDRLNALIHMYNVNQEGDVSETDIVEYIFKSIDLDILPAVLNSLVGAFGNFLIAAFSVLFISFFFLKDKDLIINLIGLLTPDRMKENVERIRRNVRKTLSRYFVGLIIQVIAITTCVFIGLSIIGVKNALLIAFFTGVVNLVPYLGPWIGASFGVFILVANNIDASFASEIQPKLIGLLIVFASTQMIDNYVFQPLIFSNSINAHPLEIFLIILIAGTIGGIGGMVAAIPVYSILRIIFIEMNKEFGWIASLHRGNS